MPPGPRERWVPARMLLLTGLRASISPLSAKHAVGCSRPTLLPLGWTARPLIPQLGWDNTSQSPGCPGLWWARGHLARPGISASSGPHAPRWLRLAEEGRAKGSPPHGHPVTGCWLRRSRPAASGSSLIQESLLGSDPEGTRRSGSSTGPTQQQSGTEQTRLCLKHRADPGLVIDAGKPCPTWQVNLALKAVAQSPLAKACAHQFPTDLSTPVDVWSMDSPFIPRALLST